ncbi:MAG: DUF2062 domain-containing protein, partial [Desulfurobacterium sp.]
DFTSVSSLISSGKEIIFPTFVGGIFLGAIFSVLSYFGIKKLLAKEAMVVKSYVKSIRKPKISKSIRS